MRPNVQSQGTGRKPGEDALHDGLAGQFLGLGLVADDDAVAQHVQADVLHVLRRDVAAPVQEGVRAGGERQVDRRARAGAAADHAVELELVAGRVARGEHHVHDVVLHPVVDVDGVDHLARGEDVVAGATVGVDGERRRAGAHEVEDLPLLGARGVGDVQLEHEAVELRLGKLVGAFLVERVLRGEHQERVGQRIGRVADGDLALLHGFEQGALHLGRGAVDFVGEDEVGEERAALGG